jgi:SAM-dependent methyltransferase
MAMRTAFERVMEQPWVYRVWQAPFADRKFEPVQRQLNLKQPRRVLDVGCGPGTNAPRFSGSEYVGIDINEHYLEMGRARHPGLFVQADLSVADLSHLGKFDLVLVNSFLHHLTDEGVEHILSRIPRLMETDGRVHILELVRPEARNLATVMAYLDRGRYARTVDRWKAMFEQHFEPVVIEPYMLGKWLWAMLYFQGKAKQCGSR